MSKIIDFMFSQQDLISICRLHWGSEENRKLAVAISSGDKALQKAYKKAIAKERKAVVHILKTCINKILFEPVGYAQGIEICLSANILAATKNLNKDRSLCSIHLCPVLMFLRDIDRMTFGKTVYNYYDYFLHKKYRPMPKYEYKYDDNGNVIDAEVWYKANLQRLSFLAQAQAQLKHDIQTHCNTVLKTHPEFILLKNIAEALQ